MYSLAQMTGDLKCDYQRYVELHRPAPRHRPPSRIRVLLSSPGFFVIAAYRIRYWIKTRQERTGSRLLWYLLKYTERVASPLSVVLMKTKFAWWPTIGPGLYLSNRGGIIVGAKKVVGCVIHDTVTIGMDKDRGRPEIGDRVWIGPDTVIYGDITIGSGVVIHGSTVVGKSIPDRCVVKGNPGRIVKRGADASSDLPSGNPRYDGACNGVKPAIRSMFEDLRADLKTYCKGNSSTASKLRVIRKSYGFRTTVIYRFGQWINSTLVHPVLWPVKCGLLGVYFCLSWTVGKAFGIQIDRRASIGEGLHIYHFGGIVIGPCRLGKNCTIHQHVHWGRPRQMASVQAHRWAITSGSDRTHESWDG